MPNHRLDPLLRPASIAVVGASRRPSSVGNEVLVNLQKGGYRGTLYLVNPSAEPILGLPSFSSLELLPEVPDHVIFAVSDLRLEACFEQAVALGVKAVTIFSSLQLATDSAPLLRQRIADKAAAAGILLHGANCMGFFNFNDGLWCSGFDTRAHRSPGNVSLICQSGAGMSGILDCEQRIDFNFAASTGQELCLSMEDYLDFVLDLDSTRVVGLFLETSRHPAKFIAALAKAWQRKIPIVVLKVGKTDLAAELALSHSGALSGSDAAYQAVFDRYGVQRVEDMAQLATALIMFAQPLAVASGSLVSLHDSGGERQLAIDLAASLDVSFATLQPDTVAELECLLDPGLPAVNPLDGWGSGGPDAGEMMQACFSTLLRDPGAALGAVIHDRAPEGAIYPAYLDYLREAQQATAKPVFLVANHRGSGDDGGLALQATRAGIPVLDGLREFMVGSRCLLAYRDARLQDSEDVPVLDANRLSHWRGVLRTSDSLGEVAAGQMLRDFGIPMLESWSVTSRVALEELAEHMEYPLVLKTAAGIAHKSDVGGVVLGLASCDQLLAAYDEMAARLGPEALVMPMAQAQGVEMILGIARDAQFGPTIVLGMGGIYTEALKDVRTLLPPFSADTAARAVAELRLGALLEEQRGRPALPVQDFCEAAARLSVLALELADCIAEIDINPFSLSPTGLMGLDALVVPRRYNGTK